MSCDRFPIYAGHRGGRVGRGEHCLACAHVTHHLARARARGKRLFTTRTRGHGARGRTRHTHGPTHATKRSEQSTRATGLRPQHAPTLRANYRRAMLCPARQILSSAYSATGAASHASGRMCPGSRGPTTSITRASGGGHSRVANTTTHLIESPTGRERETATQKQQARLRENPCGAWTAG